MLGYFGLTRLWVTVPENWGYEMSQYTLLYLLLLVLLAWTTITPTIPSVVRNTLILSVGVVAVIGVIQSFYPGIAPAAINPFGEVGNPSLMGYKNPAALSVMAQIFILAGAAFSLKDRRVGLKRLLGILLVAELVYLVSLQSRTAYLSARLGFNGAGRTLAALLTRSPASAHGGSRSRDARRPRQSRGQSSGVGESEVGRPPSEIAPRISRI